MLHDRNVGGNPDVMARHVPLSCFLVERPRTMRAIRDAAIGEDGSSSSLWHQQ
jgi:hypothetical protein